MPFTPLEFLRVFAAYNTAVWPLQIIFVVVAVLAIGLAVRPRRRSDRFVSFVLAFFWIWMGIVYHLIYFTSINTAAYLFGVLNIIQGGLFVYYGIVKRSLSFRFRADLFGIAGAILILYGLLVYPILGYFLGHRYPESPTFGLPCPTTIFTFGILLLLDGRMPVPVFIIPLLWSVIGFTAAMNLGIVEDAGLLVAGLTALVLLVVRNRASRTMEQGR